MSGFTRGTALIALLLGAAACKQQGSERQARRPQPGEQAPMTAERPAGAADRQAAAAPGEQRTVSGEVARVGSDELVVRQGGGEPELRLRVGPETPVTIGGQQAAVSDLKEGTAVRASYQEEGGAARAIRIEAQPSGAAGSAPGGAGGAAGTDTRR